MGEHTDSPAEATGQKINHKWEIGRNPRKKSYRQVQCAPLPPVGCPSTVTPYRILPTHMDWIIGGYPCHNLGHIPYASSPPWGLPWHVLCSRGSSSPFWLSVGGVDTLLVHPHPPAHLGLLLHHHPPRKSSFQEVGPTGRRGEAGGATPGHSP